MPRALVVTSSFLPGRGGIESYLAKLCEELAPHVSVLAPPFRDGRPIPRDLPYATHAFARKTLLPRAALAEEIARVANIESADRVVFGTPWPLSLLGPRLRRNGLRYAVVVHGAEMLVPSRVPGLRKSLAHALADADLLLPVSEFTDRTTRGFLERTTGASPPSAVLRARVDLERFTPAADARAVRRRLGLDDDDRIILCFGRLVRRKGVHRVIRALDDITARVPKAVLVVGGTGPQLRRLERMTKGRGTRVIFLGRVPDDDAPALFAAADAFALPVVDRWFGLEVEGLGVVLLEAAAAGTACVTGTSGGTPEAVVDGETGYVIDAADREKLVSALSTLLDDRELAAAMGITGRKHVEENFAQRRLPPSFLDWLGLDQSWSSSRRHAKEG